MWQLLNDFVQLVFGGDFPQRPLGPGQTAARAFVIYLFGLFVVRVGKSRMLSRATPLDVVVTFLLAALLGQGITGSASLSGTGIACVVLTVLHWCFTGLACRSHRFGSLMKGVPKAIIHEGQLQRDTMRESHISAADLHEALRLNAHIDDPGLVKAAFKERSGDISVLLAERPPRIIEVNVAQGVQTVRIELAG